MTIDIEYLRADSEISQERKRSWVRILVTYAFAATYLFGAISFILYFLMKKDPDVESALVIFSGLSSAALGIVGFWFGGRNLKLDEKAGLLRKQNNSANGGSDNVDEVGIITAPTIAQITAEISVATLSDLTKDSHLKLPVEAVESATKQPLIGTMYVDLDRLVFVFDKTRSPTEISTLPKPLTGSIGLPAANQAINLGQEIILTD